MKSRRPWVESSTCWSRATGTATTTRATAETIPGIAACSGLARSGHGRLSRGLRSAAAEARDGLLQPAVWPTVLLASLLVVGTHIGMFLLAARGR